VRQIDGAIQQCALENKLTPSSVVTAEQLLPYLPQGADVFRCPSGGTYTFGVVSKTPLCSIQGHVIPDMPRDWGDPSVETNTPKGALKMFIRPANEADTGGQAAQ
jgi:hypothetical protein